MIGSFAPSATDNTFKTGRTLFLSKKKNLFKFCSEQETAPSGMLARGHYKVKSKFIDDDKAGIFEFFRIFENLSKAQNTNPFNQGGTRLLGVGH